MSSLDMPVTLIVKAPNQQIQDQSIDCELSWSILQLKGHLSKVYPCNPKIEEQKLIYSGHLLQDSLVLGDVLRTCEGQLQNTVHLVCSRQTVPTSTPSTSQNNETTVENSDQERTEGLRRRHESSSVSSSNSSSSSGNGGSTGTSSTSTHSTSSTFVNTDSRQMWGAHYFPGASITPYAQFPHAPPYPASPQMAHLTQAQYAAWMQQAYAQYMAQYMHLMMSQATGSPMQWPLAASVASDNSPPNNEQPPAPQGQAAMGAERGGGEDEEDDLAAQRDLLDWFYIASRMAVLFSVVYFYSSPVRFIVVFLIGLLMHLYQIGFFRADEVADNNNDPARADAAAANNNNNLNNDNNNNEPPVAAPADGEQANEGGPTPAGVGGEQAVVPGNGAGAGAADNARTNPNAASQRQQPDRPSFLALTWTFFTSFIASLIPEQPNVI